METYIDHTGTDQNAVNHQITRAIAELRSLIKMSDVHNARLALQIAVDLSREEEPEKQLDGLRLVR